MGCYFFHNGQAAKERQQPRLRPPEKERGSRRGCCTVERPQSALLGQIDRDGQFIELGLLDDAGSIQQSGSRTPSV